MSRYPTWKREALKKARLDIIELEDDGHHVTMCTDYHWKIDGIDVWPSSMKYMKDDGIVRHFESIKDVLK